jgi:hypothetical protein
MMTFLLLVTWLAYGQPPSDYQVPFTHSQAQHCPLPERQADRVLGWPGPAALLPVGCGPVALEVHHLGFAGDRQVPISW